MRTGSFLLSCFTSHTLNSLHLLLADWTEHRSRLRYIRFMQTLPKCESRCCSARPNARKPPTTQTLIVRLLIDRSPNSRSGSFRFVQLPVWTTLALTLVVACYATFLVPIGFPAVVKIGFPAMGAWSFSGAEADSSNSKDHAYIVEKAEAEGCRRMLQSTT